MKLCLYMREIMPHSCGALLYTIDPQGRLGVVLGREFGSWCLFKGCQEPGESFEECAEREIFEETGGLLRVKRPYLGCHFSNRVKTYHIGLEYLPYELIGAFNGRRAHENPVFNEKDEMRFFEYGKLNLDEHHMHVRVAIQYYADQLDIIAQRQSKHMDFVKWRAQGIRPGCQTVKRRIPTNIGKNIIARGSASTSMAWRSALTQ